MSAGDAPVETMLDAAFLRAEASGDDADLRRFYGMLAETTLCAPVEPESGDTLKPVVFPLESGPTALAFDTESRLAAFFGAATEYVEIPGRDLIASLASQGLALGLNMGVAPASTLLPNAALTWIAEEGGATVEEAEPSANVEVFSPTGAPAALLAALAERVAAHPGLIEEAWLARLRDDAGARLVVVLVAGVAARRAETAMAAELARIATLYAAEGEPVEVAPTAKGSPLHLAAEARGAPLHVTEAELAARAAGKNAAPPRLR